MSMEEMIRAWKADEEALEPGLPASPVGRELSEQELLNVAGSDGQPWCLPPTCDITYCFFSTSIIAVQ
ncbi:MAG: hypothetical protein ACJ8BW_12595 [Ktedonobacteraceae bacterium]